MNSASGMKEVKTLRVPKECKALLAALQMHNGCLEELQVLSDEEWGSLLSFCELAHLTFPLQQLETGGFPDWVQERLKKNAADNATRFKRIKVTFAEIANALESTGAKYVVLKGFAQCPEFVSDPRLRVQSDIDIYCPGDAIQHAYTALSAIGYYPEQTLDYRDTDHLPMMVRATDWSWRGNAFDPDMPLSVELHFCVWNEKTYRFAIPHANSFWGRRIIRNLDGFTFPAFCTVDNLGYSALHVLRGLLAGDWVIHHVYELAAFLHRHAKDISFWASWRELHAGSLRAFEAIAFSLAKIWFGCDLSPEAQAEIDNLSPAIQEWLHKFAGSPLDGMFRQNKDHLWLHLSLLTSSRHKQTVFWKSLFPVQIPPLNTPAVNLNNRRAVAFWPSQRHIKYLLYFTSRSAKYARLLPITLWRGLVWGLSQRQLGRQVWTFLAASFFLTWACSFISSYSISS